MRVISALLLLYIVKVDHVFGGSSSSPPSSSSSSGASPSTQFSFEVKDGKLSELDGIDPSVTWTTSKQKGPYNLSCGVDVSVRPNTDYFTEVKSIWGRVSRSVVIQNKNISKMSRRFGRGGKGKDSSKSVWNISGRASVDVENYEEDPSILLDLRAVNSEEDAAFKVVASAGNDEVSIDEIQMSKGFQALDGRLSINPRYDRTGSHVSDVVLGYDDTKTGTNVQVVASIDEQSLRVMRRVGDKDAIAPTISTSGKVVLEWLHDLNEDGDAVITTIEPNECVNVQWTDGPWTANVRAPLNRRIMMDQVEVSIKRKMDLSQEDLTSLLSSSDGEEEENSDKSDVSSFLSSLTEGKEEEESSNGFVPETTTSKEESAPPPKMKYFGWYGRFF